MKKSILSLLAFCLVFWSVSGMAQLRPYFPKVKKDYKVLRAHTVPKDYTGPGIKALNPTVTDKSVLDDTILMVTRYDLQTNSSTENRIYMYSDGKIGATGMM